MKVLVKSSYGLCLSCHCLRVLTGQAKSLPAHDKVGPYVKFSYLLSPRKKLKYHIYRRKKSVITCQCMHCEIYFKYTSHSRAHIQFAHDTVQFFFNKYTFKGNTREYLQGHIFWILEGKVPQCEFCDDRPT